MSTNGRSRNNEPGVATSFSELTHDVIELAELQAQLFALDVKEHLGKDADIAAVGGCRRLRAAGLDSGRIICTRRIAASNNSSGLRRPVSA